MKSPITDKEMTLQIEKSILSFRKEKFDYYHLSFYCDGSKESFTTTDLDELNLNQVYNQYRDKHNIPFTDEIIELKKKFSLSASKISQILGLGVNGFRNYEKGEVPSLAISNLIKTIINNSVILKGLVQDNNDITGKIKILKKIDNVINSENESFNDDNYVHQLFDNNLLPDLNSGYRKPSMSKLSQMVVFFTEKLKPTKTMMNKLLFYADFLNYKNTAYSISGVNYLAHNYGPVPVRFNGIFDYITNKNLVNVLFEDYGEYTGERFVPNDFNRFNSEVFLESELEVLNTIAKKFDGCNAKAITKLSHEETAWTENKKEKNIINYNYSFELKHV